LDPRPKSDAPTVDGAIHPEDEFFDDVSFYGAFDPTKDLWTDNWTALDAYGFTTESGVSSIEGLTGNGIPTSFSLSQNYPNPFNPSTTINYSLPQSGYVSLVVYNMLGQRVAVLVDGNRDAGYYSTNFDASNLASGWYIYQLRTESKVFSKRMLLLK